MANSRRRKNDNNYDKGNLDRKMGQFLDAGRQLIDGVSGTRPGGRKRSSLKDFSRTNVRNMGNWINDKVDDFLNDDYDDWGQRLDVDNKSNFKSFNRDQSNIQIVDPKKKRPLEAISLREPININEDQKKLTTGKEDRKLEWEDDSYFKANRWQRNSQTNNTNNFDDRLKQEKVPKARNLPRSRRRRT